MAYGHDLQGDDDVYLNLSQSINYAADNSGPLGSTPVDFLPFCTVSLTVLRIRTSHKALNLWIVKFFPSWFPGTHYANHARKYLGTVQSFVNLPYTDLMKKWVSISTQSLLLLSH
jgi:hypothetical protein